MHLQHPKKGCQKCSKSEKMDSEKNFKKIEKSRFFQASPYNDAFFVKIQKNEVL